MKHTHPIARPTERSKAAIGAVCAITRILPGEVLSLARKQPIVDARWAVFWFLKHECKYATFKIGRVMGRDHTTVLWALKHVTDKQIDIAKRAKERLTRTCPELFRPCRDQPAQEMRVTA
jgi:chromosomal replication initiation ATPase DnaA